MLLPLFSLVLLLIPAGITLVDSRTECMQVSGVLKCPSNPHLAANVRIDLKDADNIPFEIDDQMGRTWSSWDGRFTVSGCGSDFGPFNTPDPYITIEHDCPSVRWTEQEYGKRRTEFALTRTFLPDVLYIGKVYLDDSDL